MRRRELILFVGGAALGAKAIAANAQQRSMPVIGVLTAAKLPDWAANGMRAGLKEAGYVEGLSLNVILRSAEGQFDRLPALASDLVESQVAVIFATGSPVPARVAKGATSKIPIVFAYGGDPVADGLVESMNRPGANVTGATFIGTALLAKRIELLRNILPEVSDVALLVNPKGTLAEHQINDGKMAAGKLGLRLHIVNMSTESEIETGFATMNQLKVCCGASVRCWHNSDMPPWSLYVRCWGQSGKHMLPLSFSAFDPMYGPQPPTPVCIFLAVRSPGRAAWRPFWFPGMYSQRRRCRLLLNRCITGFDPYTANLDHAHGQDPKRSPATTEPFPLEAHSLLPARRAPRMDRPGRLQGDNDIVEQYSNPSKELSLPRAP